MEDRKLNPKFILGLNLIAFSAWNLGTWIGIFIAAGLPDSIKTSMGIALYAMFIGLLVPSFKKSRPVLIVSIIAVLVHSALNWLPLFSYFSSGWSIIIATICGAIIGALIFPEGAK